MKTRMTALPLAIGALLCLPTSAIAQEAPADAPAVEATDADNAASVRSAAPSDDNSASADNNTSKKEQASNQDAKAGHDDTKDGESADEDDDKNWGVSASVAFDLGIGAFTKHKYARRVRSRMVMEFSGYYTIPVIDVDVSLTTGYSVWLSEVGDSNGKHGFRWADSSVNFRREIWSIKSKVANTTDIAFSINADLGFTLPTSQASITSDLYTQIVPTIALAFSLDKFSLSYSITYAHSFHKYTSTTLNPDDLDVLSRTNGVELIGATAIAVDGVLTEIELANVFTVGYKFLPNFGLTIGLGIADAWTYDNGTITEADDLTNPNAHVGRGHQQFSQGIVALSYQPAKWVGLSFSMVSTQPWKTADNKSTRFPWFDAISPSKNFTKFMIGAQFQY